jgi:hypothetical protein
MPQTVSARLSSEAPATRVLLIAGAAIVRMPGVALSIKVMGEAAIGAGCVGRTSVMPSGKPSAMMIPASHAVRRALPQAASAASMSQAAAAANRLNTML